MLLANATLLEDVIIAPDKISTITSWTTSNTPGGIVDIDDVLIVESGNTLTVGAGVSVRFTKQGRLIVEPGATLALSGTLTNQTCYDNNAWKGVEVWGDATAAQTSSNQGRIITSSGAVIENAEIGIQAWGGDEQTGSGGIISCTGTTFLNCRYGVMLAPYQQYNGNNAPLNYLATFNACDFTIDEEYPHHRPFHSFAHLRGVRGVHFAACHFDNQQGLTSGSTAADYGYGIFAHNAGFKVLPKCLSNPEPLPCDNVLASSFEGLGYGIHIGTDNYVPIPHVIQQVDFSKCYVSIANGGIAGGQMAFNNFDLSELPGPDIINGQWGVVLANNLNGFTLEENHFSGTGASAATMGIACAQLGEFGNVVRRNTFEDVTISNAAYFQNAGQNDFPPRGLYYECNTNTHVVEYDFTVQGTIRSEQGQEISDNAYGPAGNIFSYTGTPDDSDFANPLGVINYYYYEYSSDNELPIDYSGLSLQAIEDPNSCPNNYCPPPCHNETVLGDIKNAYHVNKDDYLSAKLYYGLAVQANQPVHAEGYKKAGGYYRYQMDSTTYEVLTNLLYDTLYGNRDTLRRWIDRLDTYGAQLALAGDHRSAGNLSLAYAIIDSIPAHYTLTTPQSTDVAIIKTLYGKLSQQSVYDLSREVIQGLEVLAADTVGYGPGLARNILRLYGYDFPPHALFPVEERQWKKPLQKPMADGISVYPNPAQNNIAFEAGNNSTILSIDVINLQGQAVWSYQKDHTLTTVQWKVHALPEGLYFYRVYLSDNKTKSGKILISK